MQIRSRSFFLLISLALLGLLAAVAVVFRPITFRHRVTVTAGAPFVWTLSESGEDEMLVLGDLPEGMNWDPQLRRASWTPESHQLGMHTAGWRWGGVLSSRRLVLDIEVVGTGGMPDLADLPPARAVEDQAYEHELTAVDPEGNAVQVWLLEHPEGMTLSRAPGRCVLSWRPDQEHVGEHRISLVLISGSRSRARTLTLTVEEVNDPPVITSVPPPTASRSATYEYVLHAADEEGQAVTYSLVEGPAGMTVDARTGRLTWQPGAEAGEATDVVVKVTDAGGMSATQAFQVVFASLTRVGAFGDAAHLVGPLDDRLLIGVTHSRLKVFPRDDVNQVLSSYWTPSFSFRTFEVYRGHLYLTQGDKGVDVFDVTRPEPLRRVGRLDVKLAGSAEMERLGDRLLVPDISDCSIRVYSLAEPGRPRQTAHHPLPQSKAYPGAKLQPVKLRLNDGKLYVLGHRDLAVADARDLEQIRFLGVAPIVSRLMLGGLAVRPPHAYVFAGHEIRVFDVSDPAAIRQVAAPEGPYANFYTYCSHATLRGNTLVAYGGNGVYQYGLGNPLKPHRESAYHNRVPGCFLPGRSEDYVVDAAGRAAAMPAGGKLPTGTDPIGLDARNIVVRGSLAYAFAPDLRILDVSRPPEPTLISITACPSSSPSSMLLEGDILYTSRAIVDVADPKAPKVLSALRGGEDVALGTGGMLFSAREEGIAVWDVRDPRRPELRKTVRSDKPVQAVLVRGDILYAGSKRGTLRAYRIGDDFSLALAGEAALRRSEGGYLMDLDADEQFLYVALGGDGVVSVDARDPAHPRLHGYFDTPQDARAVKGVRGFAYVADGTGGVLIVGLAEKGPGQLVGSCAPAGSAGALALSGPYVYVCERDAGLSVLRSDLLTAVRKLPVDF
jgi:hypothetical protein